MDAMPDNTNNATRAYLMRSDGITPGTSNAPRMDAQHNPTANKQPSKQSAYHASRTASRVTSARVDNQTLDLLPFRPATPQAQHSIRQVDAIGQTECKTRGASRKNATRLRERSQQRNCHIPAPPSATRSTARTTPTASPSARPPQLRAT